MLVLSRQRNEAILIGDGIEVTIIDVRGDRVRVGITAPTEVPVFRKELINGQRRSAGRFVVARRSGALALRSR